MTDINELAVALKDVDLKGAMREAFGKCPECGNPVQAGYWLKWCNKKLVNRRCTYVAPLNRSQR